MKFNKIQSSDLIFNNICYNIEYKSFNMENVEFQLIFSFSEEKKSWILDIAELVNIEKIHFMDKIFEGWDDIKILNKNLENMGINLYNIISFEMNSQILLEADKQIKKYNKIR